MYDKLQRGSKYRKNTFSDLHIHPMLLVERVFPVCKGKRQDTKKKKYVAGHVGCCSVTEMLLTLRDVSHSHVSQEEMCNRTCYSTTGMLDVALC